MTNSIPPCFNPYIELHLGEAYPRATNVYAEIIVSEYVLSQMMSQRSSCLVDVTCNDDILAKTDSWLPQWDFKCNKDHLREMNMKGIEL